MGTCSDGKAVNKQMTATTTKQDLTWNGKKMEGDNGLYTIECLRGRLLVERKASRVAKEEAQSMANKFVELEKKLREEIKLRDKAERKLKFSKKKLESFNVSSPSGQSFSSEKCESSSCSSASRHSEANETKPHTTNPSLLENAVHDHNVAEASVLIQTHTNSPSTIKDSGSQFNDSSGFKNPNQSSEDLKNDESRLSHSSSKSLEKGYNSVDTDDCTSYQNPTHGSSENICHNPNPSNEDLMNDESRLSSISSKSSMTEYEDDHGDFVDNSLALVPVTFPATSQATSNHKPVNESVVEALDALRRAKERLLCSMGTRPMIKLPH